MKIALNITPALNRTTGIGTYARELSRALLEIDKENSYILFSLQNPFFRNPRIAKNIIKNENARSKTINVPYRILNFLWNELEIIPVEHLCGKCDIFHSLDMLSPLAAEAKVLTTIHDINWLIFDDDSNMRKKILHREVSKSLKRSEAVIVDSLFTKNELLKYFPFLHAKRIEIIHLGVSEIFKPLDKAYLERFKKRYGWGEFILYLGALDQSRKNLIRLIKAYSNLRRKRLIRERLVLCGRASKRTKELLNVIDEQGVREDIIIYNEWIPDGDIPVIYNMARAVVYPSLYEGFGLPILEAMACGKPVITSRIASLPEAGGDAAYYIDPHDVGDIEKGIEEVLTNRETYSKFVEKGLAHAKRFTWLETAKKTLDIYKAIHFDA